MPFLGGERTVPGFRGSGFRGLGVWGLGVEDLVVVG